MHTCNRTANLLGATALAVTDIALVGATKAAGVSTSGAAALITLAANPGLSVTELGRRIALTQSAAARMVDTLEATGLVHREPTIGRWVSVTLTEAGHQTARQVLNERGAPLTDVITALDADEQVVLAELLSKLLARLYGEIGDHRVMCRLCEAEVCEECPIGEAHRKQQH
jgi:DNA-binding MarR family transcriptional regulator